MKNPNEATLLVSSRWFKDKVALFTKTTRGSWWCWRCDPELKQHLHGKNAKQCKLTLEGKKWSWKWV